MAFAEVGVELEFKGSGPDEKAYVSSSTNPEFRLEKGKQVMSIDPRYYRPTEVDLLIGDAGKARTKLGWTPRYDLKQLVQEMMQCDIELFRKDKYLKEGGHKIFNYHE